MKRRVKYCALQSHGCECEDCMKLFSETLSDIPVVSICILDALELAPLAVSAAACQLSEIGRNEMRADVTQMMAIETGTEVRVINSVYCSGSLM